MQSNPIVSEFSLRQGQQIPQYLARSRYKESPKSAFSKSACGPIGFNQEIIINVKKFNPQGSNCHPPSPNQDNNIRSDIDACLDAVQTAYSKRRNKNPQQNFIQDPSTLKQSIITDDAIHRIDSNIVMNYIDTVFKDYQVRNRYGDFNTALLHRNNDAINQNEQSNVQIQYRERASSLNRPSQRPQKQFLNVTQESKFTRKDVSYSSIKKLDQTFVNSSKREHRLTISSHGSPFNNLPPATTRVPQSTIKKSQCFQKVQEDFRYCVSCQKPILTINIDFHEQYDCPNFQNLYRMSFKELAEFVDERSRRIKQELKQKLIVLKQKNQDGQRRVDLVINNIVDLMDQYVKEQRNEILKFKDELIEEQKRLKYSKFQESEKNIYAEAIELTHKLRWFQEISIKLRKEDQLTTHESTKKLEETRPIHFLRAMTTPTSLKRPQMELSPVTYLHPHLHRFSKQAA